LGRAKTENLLHPGMNEVFKTALAATMLRIVSGTLSTAGVEELR
jgi:hypothetical protein